MGMRWVISQNTMGVTVVQGEPSRIMACVSGRGVLVLPSRNMTVYGAFKTAYKSGGFSNSGFVSASTKPGDVAFNPETAAGFEVGFKSTLMDRQLRFNIDAYTYKYKDLQVDFFNSNTFAFITTNAGGARTKGVEAELEYAPRAVPGLNLRGSINYNHARYTNYIAPCFGGQSYEAGCNTYFNPTGSAVVPGVTPVGQDLSGKPTAVSPSWTGSMGLAYEAPISNDWKVGLTLDSRYSSAYLASGFGAPLSRQDPYLTIDGTISVKTADGRYEFSVIGKNLTNHFVVGGVVDGPNTGANTGNHANAAAAPVSADQLGFVSLPRTVQFQATVRF